jgi:hypothetical protein
MMANKERIEENNEELQECIALAENLPDAGGVRNEVDPTVPEWAKQPKKPTYTAQEVGAVSQQELTAAVEDALQEAKESGEFKGDTPVKGTDYFTQADKAEMVAAVIAALPVYGGETA